MACIRSVYGELVDLQYEISSRQAQVKIVPPRMSCMLSCKSADKALNQNGLPASAMRLRIFFSWIFFFTFVPTEAGARTLQSSAGLVVADSELASEAGMEVLRRGGNAVDAAIATAFALSVVDQASSGLGGGGFMVIYRAKDQRAVTLDFRETAPETARRELYMKDGKPVPALSLTGGLAVAEIGRA